MHSKSITKENVESTVAKDIIWKKGRDICFFIHIPVEGTVLRVHKMMYCLDSQLPYCE